MKAAVLHNYGPPSNLKYEESSDPHAGPGEVCIRMFAMSVNPIDLKLRSGAMKAMLPLQFPAILGANLAGVVDQAGPGVDDFKKGDKVFAFAQHTYAELCVVKAANVAKIPEGLEMIAASAIPMVCVTGDQLIHTATQAQKNQTILLTGALGSVGRCALFAALESGVKVIAVVRKNQVEEALKLGATSAFAIEDEQALAGMDAVDGVADTIGGELGPRLLAKVKPGGNYGSVAGPPKGADRYPQVKVTAFSAHPDAPRSVHYAEAIRDGKLALPIDRTMPLAQAAEAHAAAEQGTNGKIVLVP